MKAIKTELQRWAVSCQQWNLGAMLEAQQLTRHIFPVCRNSRNPPRHWFGAETISLLSIILKVLHIFPFVCHIRSLSVRSISVIVLFTFKSVLSSITLKETSTSPRSSLPSWMSLCLLLCVCRQMRSGSRLCRPSPPSPSSALRTRTPSPARAPVPRGLLSRPLRAPRSTKPRWREVLEKTRTKSTDSSIWGCARLPVPWYLWANC